MTKETELFSHNLQVKSSGQVSVQPTETKDQIITVSQVNTPIEMNTQSSAAQDRQDKSAGNKNATISSKPVKLYEKIVISQIQG
jgi:hypothetical protein